MRVEPIRQPLSGERVLAVSPAVAPFVSVPWHRRLNLFTGRSLSDTALSAEQEGRAGRLALRGQSLSPGVVSGLELDVEREAANGGRLFLRLAAGSGLAASGEDVLLPRPLRVEFGALPVYAPPSLLRGPGEAAEDGPPQPPTAGGLQVRRLGRSLQELIAVQAPLPPVGVLVLEPVVVELIGRLDPDDPCEQDPQAFAFENWELADGCRLLFYPWPTEWRPLPVRQESGQPPPAGTPPADRWRNRLAYAVFEAERSLGPDELLPWETLGLPIGLVGFDPAWQPVVVDRYAVVRAGGRPKRRSVLLEQGQPLLAAGSHFLWQAQVQQLAEHLADPALAALAPAELAAQLRYLPPVGLLPKSAVEPRSGQSAFFPSSYQVEVAPVPFEQLDAVLEQGASLAPFDLFTPDQVRVLVPVPQAVFEPRLLLLDTVSGEFQQAIDRFVAERTEWLHRRELVRQRFSALQQAIAGQPPSFPEPESEPGRLEPEASRPAAPFATPAAHQSALLAGLHQHLVIGATATLPVAAGEALVAWIYLDPDHPPAEVMLQWHDGTSWEHRAYWGQDLIALGQPGSTSRRPIGPLPAAGAWVRLDVPAGLVGLENATVSGLAFTLHGGRAAWGPAGKAILSRAPSEDQVWLGAALPAGARAEGNEPWVFIGPDDLLTPFEDSFGTSLVDGSRVADALEALKQQLDSASPVRSETADDLAALPAGVQLPAALASRIRFDASRHQLIFRGAMTVEQRDLLLTVSPDPAYQLSIQELFARTQDDELGELDRRGLEGFIAYLEDKVRRANDQIDFGFLRVQSDIYRIRQLMLGSDAAARLATSTTLASIAKGESAIATRDDLQKFLQQARGSLPGPSGEAAIQPTSAPPPAGAGAGAGAGASPLGLTKPRSGGSVSVPGGLSTGGSSFDRLRRGGLVVDSGLGGEVSPLARPRPDLDAELDRLPRDPFDPRGGIEPDIDIDAFPPDTPRPPRSPDTTPPPQEQVTQQQPIVGKSYDFRTVTIAERIAEAPAPEAKSFAVASKFEVVKSLASFDLNLDDLEAPGFYELDANGNPVTEAVIISPTAGGRTRLVPREARHSFRQIRKLDLADQILLDRHDPDPPNADESGFFAAGVRALDHTTAILRLVEGRVQAYRQAIALCQRVLAELRARAAQANGRLAVIEAELGEARHDVAVARALLAEETARIQRINDRRSEILREQVAFLAYQRPRTVDTALDLPSRALEPGPTESPVPACLGEDGVVPAEIRAMVDLLREVPVRWLPHLPILLERLDHLELLQQTILVARQRAQLQPPFAAATAAAALGGGRLGQSISQVMLAQQQAVALQRLQTAQLDPGLLAGATWRQTRDLAAEVISLGDLVDARHGRSDLARRAARELDEVAQVAACLNREVGEVLPAIRLAWAERLSEFDAPANLRSLAGLPRWGEIETLQRRELQGLVDWLFQRIDDRQPEAVALLNELIRVCILLASHAPVRRIVAGQVERATTVQTGGRVELRVDPAHVRVGMQVLMFAGQEVVARGVVDDLAAGRAAARIVQLQAGQSSVNLAQDARVHFAEPEPSSAPSGLAAEAARAPGGGR